MTIIKEDSKYVPTIDFVALIKSEIYTIRDWMFEVDLWATKVVKDRREYDDEMTIEQITDMVLENNFDEATDVHTEFINFAWQTRCLSGTKCELDIDVLEVYLGWICDRCRGL